MKYVHKARVYGYIMTGLIGKDGKWFLGFSKTIRSDSYE
jgi:hypothetical protein